MQPTKAQVENRKRIEKERQAAEANRPRVGAGSSARQAELNKYNKPKPAAKSTAKPAARSSYKVADYTDAQGNVYDGNTGRLKRAAKPAAKASPAPSSRPSSTSARSSGGGSTQSSAKASSSPSQASSSTAKTGGSYGESGRELYNSGKKDNPLMKRTFGYQTGDAPSQRKTEGIGPVADGNAYAESIKKADLERAKSDADKAKIKQRPPQPAQPAQPASPNDKKPDVGYKPNTQINKNYADKKPSNNTKTAYDGRLNLLEELRKRRTNR